MRTVGGLQEVAVLHPCNDRDVAQSPSASIIIPTFNGARRIGNCLAALLQQIAGKNAEILVVNDGSTDDVAGMVARYPSVRLINQRNSGPAAARNRGALEACGNIILFTDDDCVPVSNWLSSMLEPFDDPEIVGVKGVYRTRQSRLAARFVQVEYEDRYRRMAGMRSIDFIDTYSAAFRRDRFLELKGYDTDFPVACAEDIELSYRMSARGWKMKFAPQAVVYHTHPDTLWGYLKKKYKFAFWRVLAVIKNPAKALSDSHTPQLMKVQLLIAPVLLLAVLYDVAKRPRLPTSTVVLVLFLVSTLPFTMRALVKDPLVGALAPALLAARACAQGMGVVAGFFYTRRRPRPARTKVNA
jgi:cellulose synthase/poly-beta-1,6-N-acetylglucosamine synthase-like glycosyltransferase